jgi:p-hydroxybenzoate 3-monooxygenase
MKTRVVIVGGGPAGTLLSHILESAGIESVVLERRAKEYVLGRIRAGVLEQGGVEVLRRHGLGDRMDVEGFVHEGINLAYSGGMFRIGFDTLVGSSVMIYGQTEIQKDLYDAREAKGGTVIDEAADVAIHDIDTDAPFVTYSRGDQRHRIDCDFVAGCDGYHGVSRESMPDGLLTSYEKIYPFGWLGVLSETPPVNDELIYANHERGFALCSMRNEMLSRYYIQCPLDTNVAEWPDDRFWDELKRRLPAQVAASMVTGPSIEKSIAPLRSFVAEPMRYERLFLAGDAAHIVPPTGAKGLNLAISDVVYLSRALIDFYSTGRTTGLDEYSATALDRVWKAVRFSWWMTTLLHKFPDDEIGQKIQDTELKYLSESTAAQTALSENYVGLPLYDGVG